MSSLPSQCRNGWARLRAKKKRSQPLWSMLPSGQGGEDKKRRISLGRSSLPSPVGPRQGHLASGAMHPPLLHFPRLFLSLPRRAGRRGRQGAPCLMHRAAPLQLSCAETELSGRFSPSSLPTSPLTTGRLHSYSLSLFLSLSAFRATRLLSRLELSSTPLSSRDSERARARARDRLSWPIGRDARLSFSFLIPLTLALFSPLPPPPSPALSL